MTGALKLMLGMFAGGCQPPGNGRDPGSAGGCAWTGDGTAPGAFGIETPGGGAVVKPGGQPLSSL